MSDLAAPDNTLLDARGMTCPIPVLRARKTLKAMELGQSLTVLATDPGSVRDFQAFCRQTGNQLVEWNESAEGVFRYVIRKTV